MAADRSRALWYRWIPGLIRLIQGWIRSIYQASRYGIKRGYLHHKTILMHDDRGLSDIFQKEVYLKAASLMAEHHWTTVLDMGCGSGYKSVQYLGQYQLTGVDLPPVIDQARNDYPLHFWIDARDFKPEEYTAELILCADVIEHVEDPDMFLKSVLAIRGWKCIMISTPERNLRRGWWHFGPPPNPVHWREWTMAELNKFISGYCRVQSIDIINREQHTQLLISMNTPPENLY